MDRALVFASPSARFSGCLATHFVPSFFRPRKPGPSASLPTPVANPADQQYTSSQAPSDATSTYSRRKPERGNDRDPDRDPDRDRAIRRWRLRRDRNQVVDKEELESEFDPISETASAVEYVRHGKREFFLHSGAHNSSLTPSGAVDPRRAPAAPADVGSARTLSVIESSTSSKTWSGKALDRVLRYFLPDGYPHSVGEDYLPYTRWRLAAFFFGGAVGVFSTQGLLLAIGVGRESATPLAAALQWVIRDGMGRAGRMLFSQIGTGFDAETKQYRLAAAFVLNLSCALESVTAAVPRLFLPLACVANMAKGMSTVAAASTRSAIYRSFMRRENLGDIVAKQETVGVAGDLSGTAVGIMLSRFTEGCARKAALAFVAVSVAHLFCVYHEIKGVQLGTLNRQRAHMLIKMYLAEGKVPDLADGNRNERILNRPWLDSLHAPNIDLGARLHECAPDAEALAYLLRMYRNERYMFTYEDTRMKIVLRNDATSRDALKAFLQADYFWKLYTQNGVRESRNRELVQESLRFVNSKFERFAKEANQKGWRTSAVLLRPIGRRAAWGAALAPVRRIQL